MSIRGRVAIVGVGETTYYKHGRAPESEFALALRAILSACEDAGIDPRQVDGFASYSNDRNDPSRLAAALGLPELRFSNMQWGGGGGGGSAAVGNAAAAVAAGYADCVVVFRALAQGPEYRNAARGHNAPTYASASFTTVAPHLWEMAGLGAKDVDVVQSYENFTGGVLMSLVEHGFFAPEEANEFLTFDNLIAPRGRLPLNTSGGNLAECYMHGLELQIEAVRQLRGQSTSQVPGARVGLVISGPMVTPVSSMLVGTGDTLRAPRRICPPGCRARGGAGTGSAGRAGAA